VAAPIPEVWEFHSRIDGLEALTPGFLDLRVEALRIPTGDGTSDGDETGGGDADSDDADHAAPDTLLPAGADPEGILVVGSEIDLSMAPLGAGPRQSWTSRITERETGSGWGRFVDEMVGGPFARWEHTHRFFGDGEETVIEDRVDYRLPLGGLGEAVGPLAVVGFEPMFRYRHRETKRRLESATHP